jgi:hypothetical protein
MINTLSGNQLLGALVRWENHPKTDDLPLPRGVVRECFSMMLPHAGSRCSTLLCILGVLHIQNLIILHSHLFTHQSLSALAVEFSIKIAKYSRIESV